ncbi:MAG: FtsX-like permease family protein [Bacteroides sp.]|nr:FtsX-like permease family protein [Bacteroides sp.]
MDQFKTGIRALLKQRFYSFLNIAGFGLGITVFCFVSIYVIDQYLYDRWNPERETIYRLETGTWSLTGTMMGPYLEERIPELEQFVRVDIRIGQNADITVGDKIFVIPHMIMADSTFFDFFPLEFIAGLPAKALINEQSIVLTRTQAMNIFGRIDVVGETLRFRNKFTLQVTGVVEDVRYSHFPISAIIPFHFLAELTGDPDILNVFGGWNYFTFFKLNPNTDVKTAEEKITQVLGNYYFEQTGETTDRVFTLFPYSKIYFSDHIVHEIPILHGSLRTVNAFGILAVFVLVIAIINFVNMATARAANRSKEVGVRKLLGGTRKELIIQFLVESVITTAIALIFAMVLVEALLPNFNALANTHFRTSDLNFLGVLLILVIATLSIGFLSGIYPAFYLTAFQPVAALKGERSRGKKGAFLRKGLIVFQFMVSIALIAFTITVFRQINYMKNKPLGFDPENVVFFTIDMETGQRKDALAAALAEHPEVLEVNFSSAVFGSITWQESTQIFGETKQYTYFPVHPGFLEMMDIQPVEGRLFDPQLRSEERNAIVINEASVNFFELGDSPQQAIGKEIDGRPVIGVVRDFHFNSLQQPIGPLVIVWWEDRCFNVLVKTTGVQLPGLMNYLEQVRNEFMPGRNFNANTVQQYFNRSYQQEERFGKIILLFAGFAIIIACLGLFGLASFTAEQRTREIALRKVLGAGIGNISMMMLKEFFVLVLVALVIAAPFVLFFTEKWLSTFAYHIQPGVMPLIYAGVMALLIMVITVGYHALRASTANPAEALKYE